MQEAEAKVHVVVVLALIIGIVLICWSTIGY